MKNTLEFNNLEQDKLPQNLEKKGKIYQVVNSELTLFSKNGKLYNKVYILENKGKLFAYNQYGEKVFFPKQGVTETGDQRFYFSQADGKYLMYIEYDGMGLYFDEKGNQYHPKSLIKKIDEKSNETLKPLLEKITVALKPIVESLYSTLHTELIFEQPELQKIPQRPKNTTKTPKNIKPTKKD